MKSLSHIFENYDINSLKDLDEKQRIIEILRICIIEEYKASNLYEKLASMINNSKVKEVLLDISNEEKTHIGEFETLLTKFDSDHLPSKQKGKKEVEG